MTAVESLKNWFYNSLDESQQQEVLKFLYGNILKSEYVNNGMYCGPAAGATGPLTKGLYLGPAPADTGTRRCPSCGQSI
jgi:hypothetical protein